MLNFNINRVSNQEQEILYSYCRKNDPEQRKACPGKMADDLVRRLEMNTIDRKLKTLISYYNRLVKGIDDAASMSQERAYGGVIRSEKGKLVEYLASQLVQIAWTDVLKQRPSRLEINRKKIPISIKDDYINRISNPKVRAYVSSYRDDLKYRFGTDVQVFIDGRIVLAIECKTYTENAMMKRILFDAKLMKEAMGLDTYYLVQLESQLGGDYSELNDITYGSPATHVLMSLIDVDLKIITLLKEERRINRPIHKPEFFKELEMRQLKKAVNLFADDLKKYAR
ncbi:MAG: restriction endonuclease [Caldicoprobacterales bacterium]